MTAESCPQCSDSLSVVPVLLTAACYAEARHLTRTVALKLTEKMRMKVDTTLSVSWLQKLNQPSRRSASLADFRFRRACGIRRFAGTPVHVVSPRSI